MAKRIFTVSLNGSDIPVGYSDGSLDEFRLKTASLVDKEIANLLAAKSGGEARRTEYLDIMGPQIYEALITGNTSKTVLCVLWLADHYPDITGIVINDTDYAFMSGGAAGDTRPLFQPGGAADSTSIDR